MFSFYPIKNSFYERECDNTHASVKGTRFEWKITFERLLVSLRNDDDDKTMWVWYKCEMCVGFYYWTLTSIESNENSSKNVYQGHRSPLCLLPLFCSTSICDVCDAFSYKFTSQVPLHLLIFMRNHLLRIKKIPSM